MQSNIREDASRDNKISFTRLDTRENFSALTVEKNGASVRLNSPMRPVSEAERWAKQFAGKADAGVVSVFGLGNGIFLRELIKLFGKRTVFLVYEPETLLFEYVKENYDISDILSNPSVILIMGSDARLTLREELIKRVDYFEIKNHPVCSHPQYEKLCPEEYNAFFDEETAHLERVNVNKNTLKRFSGPIVVNTLKNLTVMKSIHSSSQLKSILPENIPVIIVSAGPSLDKNIELLREAKGHSFIICVDTAIKFMMQKNIMPDATIVIEPEKPFVHYEDPRSREIPLITDIEANSEIVLVHNGEKFLFGCRGFVKQLLLKLGRDEHDIGSGGSVATAAFALCYQMGCKNIILIGQDLAYTGEATHAGNTQSAGINNEIGNTFVEDIDGGQVRTRGDWIAYLKWFENSVSFINESNLGITVTDATEGGAKIHGTEIITLREALDKYCSGVEYDFEKQLSTLSPMLSEEEYPLFERFLESTMNSLDKTALQAERGAAACERIISGNSENTEDKRVIAEVISYCEEEPVYALINSFSVTQMADELEKLSPEKRDNYFYRTLYAFRAITKSAAEIKMIYENL